MGSLCFRCRQIEGAGAQPTVKDPIPLVIASPEPGKPRLVPVEKNSICAGHVDLSFPTLTSPARLDNLQPMS